MTGAISLDDLNNASTDDDSTDTDDELETLCDELGADLAHADAYVAQNGQRDSLVEFARLLKDNDELFELMEEYRAAMGPHRIHEKHLRGDDGDYSTWSAQFYGDSDDPDDGTFNAIQQKARDSDGNLAFYKALFPEPQADHFPGQPVCWQDFGDDVGYGDGKQDANIYVTRDFCEEYDSFTIEVDGRERPRPPTDAEIQEMRDNSGGSGADASGKNSDHPDVWDVTSDAAREFAQSLSPAEAEEALEREKKNPQFDGGRKTVKEPLRKRANESGNTDDSSSAGSGGSDSSPAAEAGEINKMGAEGNDISPEKVVELQEEGWSKDEIIEFYG